MILHEVELHNFGIYGGRKAFEFTPARDGSFSRPITLMSGQNGVGKTTMMEAIRLGLHGSLVLGGRTSQSEYEQYLRARVFRPVMGEPPRSAQIKLRFDIFLNGRKRSYAVSRKWDVSRKSVSIGLTIDENGKELTEIDGDAFLRDLIDPGLLDLFFFDGEKIRTLAASGEGSGAFLGDTVKHLLGLQLVEQLDRDLGVYMTRADTMHELSELTQALGRVEASIALQAAQLDQTRRHVAAQKEQVRQIKRKLARSEQQLAREGGEYAERRRSLREARQTVEARIAASSAIIHELCRGVLPFAFVPELLEETKQQLLKEAEHERWEMTHDTLQELRATLLGNGFAAETIDPLFAPFESAPMPANQVVHRISPASRQQIISWIDEAMTEAPRRLLEEIGKLEEAETRLEELNTQLAKVPDEEQLRPIRERIELHKRELWDQEHTLDELESRLLQLAEEQKRLLAEQHAINDQIARSEADSTPLKLAARTRQLLQDYQERLTQEKLNLVQKHLVRHFIQLCRKRNFVDEVRIDPDTFSVLLFRNREPFPRSQLSAGEEQLFAIATLWALREVSGIPMPVLIDTPLSRLDADHRQAMLTEFFPHVSHQVIIMATDTEIDDAFTAELQPALSHHYRLSFNEEAGATEAHSQPLTPANANVVQLSSVEVK